jgi:hypothetical protein
MDHTSPAKSPMRSDIDDNLGPRTPKSERKNDEIEGGKNL